MALVNYVTKEIIFKVVYYGPPMSGKTTNLECLHSIIHPVMKGNLRSSLAGLDRTLFFDIVPPRIEKIKNFSIRFQLYTVPGNVRNGAVWKMVLNDVDSIIFVADSQRRMRDFNIESFYSMRTNLKTSDAASKDVPVILQFNKRDVDDILTVEALNADLNMRGYPYFEAIARQGRLVKETFNTVAKSLIKQAIKEHRADVTLKHAQSAQTVRAGSVPKVQKTTASDSLSMKGIENVSLVKRPQAPGARIPALNTDGRAVKSEAHRKHRDTFTTGSDKISLRKTIALQEDVSNRKKVKERHGVVREDLPFSTAQRVAQHPDDGTLSSFDQMFLAQAGVLNDSLSDQEPDTNIDTKTSPSINNIPDTSAQQAMMHDAETYVDNHRGIKPRGFWLYFWVIVLALLFGLVISYLSGI